MRDSIISARRAGSALIEVLIALTLLTLSGTALITLLGQTAHSMRTTLESERLARRAGGELNRVVIESRAELIANLGRRMDHGWSVDVTATSDNLFIVSVAQSDTAAPLLHTTLYRPRIDTANAP